jgi:type II secretory pathway pseudopilin PulG
MQRRGADEAGDSLIEIVFALVIIGVVIGAFVASFSTGATGATSHRNNVTGDVVLRNYAEAAKTAARSCTTGRTFTIAYPTSGLPLPSRYTVSSTPSLVTCPDPAGATPVTPVTLTVTLPSNLRRSLVVEVRTP